jgi:hypothetical protein
VVEFVMSANQSNRTWQADLVARYPALFDQESNGQIGTPGYPMVGDGWRDLVETAIGRIANAVAAAPTGSLKIGQIKEKFATLRVYLDGRKGLPESTNATIDEAIDLAEARSACTCETCGELGRLYKISGWYKTACDAHGEGNPIPQRPGLENLHITRRLVEGKRVVRARQYIRATDSFEEVDPSTLKLNEE